MDGTCNQAILAIQATGVNTEYLYYYLSFNESKFIRMGQTGTQSNLSKEIVEDLDIPLPSQVEQKEIATILGDFDSEISVLENQLVKAQAIKQGMMQQLLTGKIRLV
jgi:type I restriction enzyme S subunit